MNEPRLHASPSNIGAWIGFLAATFCVVGLIGLFSTYAAPLAYQRELHREQVLDQALITPPGRLAGLRDALGDSADAILTGAGPIESTRRRRASGDARAAGARGGCDS